MTSSESQPQKEIAPNVAASSGSALPDVIKNGAETIGDRAREVLDVAQIIEGIEQCLLVPHPREAYLETVVSYLREPTGSPPAPQCGMQDIQTLLQKEPITVLLPRFETLLANMKPFPDYLRGAIDYLRKPTNSIADINKHAINIGKVWILEPRHPAVQILHVYFRHLQYQFHRSAFEDAVSAEQPQDIMKFFTSYLPLSQLRDQFARDKFPHAAQEIDGMLAHEMRLKEGVDLPVRRFEAPDTTELMAGAESFSASHKLKGADVTLFGRVMAFLRSPTDKFLDIKKGCDDIGEVLMSFMDETLPELDAINLHFMYLLFGHHFTELKAAVAEAPQNIKRITGAMLQVVQTAKYAGAGAQQELNAFLGAHEIRKKPVKTAE